MVGISKTATLEKDFNSMIDEMGRSVTWFSRTLIPAAYDSSKTYQTPTDITLVSQGIIKIAQVIQPFDLQYTDIGRNSDSNMEFITKAANTIVNGDMITMGGDRYEVLESDIVAFQDTFVYRRLRIQKVNV